MVNISTRVMNKYTTKIKYSKNDINIRLPKFDLFQRTSNLLRQLQLLIKAVEEALSAVCI